MSITVEWIFNWHVELAASEISFEKLLVCTKKKMGSDVTPSGRQDIQSIINY